MDMTPFLLMRVRLRARASAASLQRYWRAFRRDNAADYVPARAKAWWIP